MTAKWIIHLKSGDTLTEKDCYPHEVDSEKITSVERIEDGQVISILKSDALSNFFVKTSASRDLIVFGEDIEAQPEEIQEKILGAFISPQKKPVRLELIFEPRTKKVKLRVILVEGIRKDGL